MLRKGWPSVGRSFRAGARLWSAVPYPGHSVGSESVSPELALHGGYRRCEFLIIIAVLLFSGSVLSIAGTAAFSRPLARSNQSGILQSCPELCRNKTAPGCEPRGHLTSERLTASAFVSLAAQLRNSKLTCAVHSLLHLYRQSTKLSSIVHRLLHLCHQFLEQGLWRAGQYLTGCTRL